MSCRPGMEPILGGLLSSSACLRFPGCSEFGNRAARKSTIFQRTAPVPLCCCLSLGVHTIAFVRKKAVGISGKHEQSAAKGGRPHPSRSRLTPLFQAHLCQSAPSADKHPAPFPGRTVPLRPFPTFQSQPQSNFLALIPNHLAPNHPAPPPKTLDPTRTLKHGGLFPKPSPTGPRVRSAMTAVTATQKRRGCESARPRRRARKPADCHRYTEPRPREPFSAGVRRSACRMATYIHPRSALTRPLPLQDHLMLDTSVWPKPQTENVH